VGANARRSPLPQPHVNKSIATKANGADMKIYLSLRYTLNPRILSRTASSIACGSVDIDRLRQVTK
jgi:hypothetical protein